MAKVKKAKEAEKPTEEVVVIPTTRSHPDQTDGEARDAQLLTPSTQGALTLSSFALLALDQEHPADLQTALADQGAAVRDGKLGRLEEMLTVQAHILDGIFNTMIRQAIPKLDYPRYVQNYLQMALKAQSQCRTTIEAIAEIKNPRPVAFIKQQNNAAGHQQVNNAAPARARARKGQTKESTNGQMAVKHEQGERLDSGAAGTAIGGDSTLEAMAAIDRPPHH